MAVGIAPKKSKQGRKPKTNGQQNRSHVQNRAVPKTERTPEEYRQINESLILDLAHMIHEEEGVCLQRDVARYATDHQQEIFTMYRKRGLKEHELNRAYEGLLSRAKRDVAGYANLSRRLATAYSKRGIGSRLGRLG